MIFVRDDDVLVPSSINSEEKFIEIHKIIASCSYLMHLPAILVSEINCFPKVINFIKEEYKKGKLIPELHGYEHKDYGVLSKEQIREDLNKSFEWFNLCFGITPKRWHLPFSSNSEEIKEVSSDFNIKLTDKTFQVYYIWGKHNIIPRIKKGECFDDKTIILHWWDKLANERLKELVFTCNLREKSK